MHKVGSIFIFLAHFWRMFSMTISAKYVDNDSKIKLATDYDGC